VSDLLHVQGLQAVLFGKVYESDRAGTNGGIQETEEFGGLFGLSKSKQRVRRGYTTGDLSVWVKMRSLRLYQ